MTELAYTYVLVSKGSGAMLLKEKTNRRRSKAEILAAKEQEAERLRDEIARIKEIQELRDKLELKNQEAKRHQQASEIINEMIRTGSAKVNEQGQLELIPQSSPSQYMEPQPGS